MTQRERKKEKQRDRKRAREQERAVTFQVYCKLLQSGAHGRAMAGPGPHPSCLSTSSLKLSFREDIHLIPGTVLYNSLLRNGNRLT